MEGQISEEDIADANADGLRIAHTIFECKECSIILGMLASHLAIKHLSLDVIVAFAGFCTALAKDSPE